jgi:ATP-binding cassette subfamily B protein RaxB
MHRDARHRQIEENECGLACVARAASLAGSHLDLRWLRERFPAPVDGFTLLKLAEIAGAVGFRTEALQCGLVELQGLRFPCVALWRSRHFVLLESATAGGLLLFDPARGRQRMDWGRASEQFNGVVLMLAATPSLQRPRLTRACPAILRPPPLRSYLGWLVGLAASWALLAAAYVEAPLMLGRLFARTEPAPSAWAWMIVACALGTGILSRAAALDALRRKAGVGLSERMFRGFVSAPLPWLRRRSPRDLIARSEFVSRVSQGLADGHMAAISDTVLALAAVLALAGLQPRSAAAALVGLVLRVAWQILCVRQTAGAAAMVRQTLAGERALLRQVLERPDTVRANGLQAIMTQRRRTIATRHFASLSAEHAWRLGAESVDLGIGVASIVVAAYATVGHAPLAAVAPPAIATFAAGVHLHLRGFALFRALRFLDDLAFRAARVADEAPPASPAPAERAPGARPTLILDQVTHRLGPSDRILFEGARATIPWGRFVAITGQRRCGLSTLAALLGGLEAPFAGTISLGEAPLCNLSPLGRRGTVGVLLENDTLVRGSVAENIAGFEEAEHAQIWAALRAVGLESVVAALPEGLATAIESRRLTEEQRRALQVARALYGAPQLLVLDQPTLFLDPRQRGALLDRLRRRDGIRIVLTRDPAVLRRADQVYELTRRGLRALLAPADSAAVTAVAL